ncbi:flagellar filament capping protein FliD [Campylobacter concisus]|jgi:flagellar hook-associated protein 2 C-terminal domain protein|uniref:Flagellar hook-associated protein 2 n=1 Tax=Campylobacter concisus TaxID=199 RepID=A0A7S9RNH0_9BACT|nr:flagellar filament capping protein FliD [Campylobacter concisus]MCA6130936.1 flagellar filament capping protein FliD [Campylobacter concisus]MCA6133155.1 flagellar filament capping protein FliD [Campylobacter concisus]QPH94937.1 flagellar filament capping protein FliD [Campylobacter concisus]
MAVGNITNLGIGTKNSGLNDELIKKLKEADEAGQIKPLTSRLEKNDLKQKDLAALKTLVSNVNVSGKTLGGEALYLKRNTNNAGSSVTASAANGVSVQSFSIDVQKLAQKDTFQSKNFKKASEIVGATSTGSFDVEIDGQKFSIGVTRSTTYQDIVDKINDVSGGKLQARILNVGGDKPNQIMLQSGKTGATQTIKISNDTSGILDKLGWDDTQFQDTDENGALLTNPDGSPKMTSNLEKNRIQKAQDAEFTYNGVNVKRDKNTFDNLRPGVTITLNEVGKTNVSISQNTDEVIKAVEEFIKDYNLMTMNLGIATSYDEEKGAGTFQGVSEISGLRSNIGRLINGQDSEGKALSKFGITPDKDGQLQLDLNKFNAALSKDPEEIQRFFMGSNKTEPITHMGNAPVSAGALNIAAGDLTINGKSVIFSTAAGSSAEDNALKLQQAINDAGIDGVTASLDQSGKRIILKRNDGQSLEIKGNSTALASLGMSEATVNPITKKIDGLFTRLNKMLDGVVGKDGTMIAMQNQLRDENKSITDNKEATQKLLDEKYTTMQERFIKYNAIIASLENQFSTLKSMIDAEINSRK